MYTSSNTEHDDLSGGHWRLVHPGSAFELDWTQGNPREGRRSEIEEFDAFYSGLAWNNFPPVTLAYIYDKNYMTAHPPNQIISLT